MAESGNLVGTVLDDKYRIERQLGQGGMGSVFLATHLHTERPVAVKVIAPAFMARDEFVERFRREAKAAGRLRHPNVVNVTDFGFATVGGARVAYLVMEYLDGITLTKLLAGGRRVDLELVVDIVEQLCLAVARAHELGIVHRDLKPDNVWLEPDGRGGYRVKVLDFGIAKLRGEPALAADALRSEAATAYAAEFEAAGETVLVDEVARTVVEEPARASSPATVRETVVQAASREDAATSPNRATTAEATELTATGTILGTPVYMSPEQSRGGRVDARSDVYSIGVIVYQMLAGEPPFLGDTYELLRKHATEPPPPLNRRRPDLPAPIAAAVMAALAKDPAARPGSALALATALAANAKGETELLRRGIDVYSRNFGASVLVALLGFTLTQLPLAVLFMSLLVPALGHPLVLVAVAVVFALGQISCNAVLSLVAIPLVSRVGSREPVALGPAVALLRSRFAAFLGTSVVAHRSFALLLAAIVVIAARPELERFGALAFWVPVVLLLAALALALRYDQQRGAWLYAPVVLLEGLSGRTALARAEALARRVEGSIGLLFPILSVIDIGVFMLAILLGWLALDPPAIDPSGALVGRAMTLAAFVLASLFHFLLGVALCPFLSIGIATFYLQARAAGGELPLQSRAG